MQEAELTYIEGTVDAVIYQNQENGYTVLRLDAGEGRGLTVVGCLPGVAPGESISVQGTWMHHASYGEQFKAETVERRMPAGTKAIFDYLASGAVRGIGAATARRMVEEFGEEALTVLEEHPEKKIFVLDTLSCSGALAGAAELANKLIGEDQTFDDICFALKKFADSTHILFALASFDNLAKNGRVNRVVGFIAGRLNMRVLGRRTPDGKIDFYFKTRGETRVLAKILEQMDEDKYDGVHPVLISECGNQNAAQLLHHGIEAKWPGAPVKIVPCSGLCSFYAQDQGIIITY